MVHVPTLQEAEASHNQAERTEEMRHWLEWKPGVSIGTMAVPYLRNAIAWLERKGVLTRLEQQKYEQLTFALRERTKIQATPICQINMFNNQTDAP